MQLTSDRSRQMAAMMFAAIMLQACGANGDTQIAGANGGPVAPTQSDIATDEGYRTGSIPEFQQTVGDTIQFGTDRYDLDSEAQSQLQKQAAWLMEYPEWKATIQGHADERGTREYNLALGERRAETARAFLVALGVDAARLQTTSYGKEQPVCGETTDECWQRNRRGVTALNP